MELWYRNPGSAIIDLGVVILADSPQGLAVGALAADALRARVIRSELIDVDAGAERLAAIASADAVLVELQRDGGAELDSLLVEIGRQVDDATTNAVICFPEALIDVVAARVVNPRIALLCAPTMLDRAAALQLAVQPRAPVLADVAGEPEAQRLLRLSEEVARIAKALAEMSVTELPPDAAVRDGGRHFAAEPARAPLDAAMVRGVIRARRIRDQFLPAGLFAEPAWDMLLDLLAARLENQPVAVSSLCIAAAVPPTTALRWIQTLADSGLIVRRPDERDGRRVFVSLADQAADALQRYFAAALQAAPLIV